MIADEELLAALRPEWAAECDALAAAPDAASAQRVLARLRSMADAMGFAAPFPEADAPFESLVGAAPALRAVLEPQAEGGGPARVLVVDDSRTIRRLLRGILEGADGLELVGEAADGHEGLRLMAEQRPDLILLDLEMPVLDGMGFLAEWALAGSGAVVVVSSAAPPGSPTALEALRRGAFCCVSKPSGALSPDLANRAGEEIVAACRRAMAR
ncbi:response regulator [Sabulicella glaciei]|uniref:Response regulator n=1 Tax=Sabulicella glaciei TaxID=2984948 RepID=A0ABT3NRW2_9PROT|nr:response regulator [Roseococcus sp. MDT2-1-1]MCW8084895.1 response regulator [Roseococcus sp. MDT2-1-1]